MKKNDLTAWALLVLGIAGAVGSFIEAKNNPVTRDEFEEQNKRIAALESMEDN